MSGGGKPRRKINPAFAEMVDLARSMVRAFDRAAAHEEEHGEVDEAKDKEAGQQALELITVVLSHAVIHHPRAIESAHRMVEDTKGRR